MVLRELNIEDKEEVIYAYNQINILPHEFGYDKFSGAYFLKLLSYMSYEELLYELEKLKNKKYVQKGESTQTVYGYFNEENKVVGFVVIRWDQTSKTTNYQGNIGALVLPEYRGNGYAVGMLQVGAMLLFEAGYDYIIVSVKPNNISSKKTLENGGAIFDHVYVDESDQQYFVYRYYKQNSKVLNKCNSNVVK